MPTNLSWDDCDQRTEWRLPHIKEASPNTPGDNTTLRVTHIRSQLSWMESPGDSEEWCHQSWERSLTELSRRIWGCQWNNQMISFVFFVILNVPCKLCFFSWMVAGVLTEETVVSTIYYFLREVGDLMANFQSMEFKNNSWIWRTSLLEEGFVWRRLCFDWRVLG